MAEGLMREGGPMGLVWKRVSREGWCGRAAGGAAALPRSGPLVHPPLNGETSGLVLEYRPAGFGYQIHTCIVVRSGCQKLNGDPVFGFVFGQVFEFSSGMKVPSL